MVVIIFTCMTVILAERYYKNIFKLHNNVVKNLCNKITKNLGY